MPSHPRTSRRVAPGHDLDKPCLGKLVSRGSVGVRVPLRLHLRPTFNQRVRGSSPGRPHQLTRHQWASIGWIAVSWLRRSGSLGIADVVRTAQIAELEDDRHILFAVQRRRPRRRASLRGEATASGWATLQRRSPIFITAINRKMAIVLTAMTDTVLPSVVFRSWSVMMSRSERLTSKAATRMAIPAAKLRTRLNIGVSPPALRLFPGHGCRSRNVARRSVWRLDEKESTVHSQQPENHSAGELPEHG